MKEKPERIVRDLRVIAQPGKDHVKVTGVLEVEGHQVPFDYKAPHDAGDEIHEKRVNAVHEKAVAWVAARPAFNAWSGAKETIGDSDIEILFSEIQMYGPHDWRTTIIWTETADGVTTKHTKSWPTAHPGAAVTLDFAQRHVRQGAASRSVSRLLNARHAAAISRIALTPHVEVDRGSREG